MKRRHDEYKVRVFPFVSGVQKDSTSRKAIADWSRTANTMSLTSEQTSEQSMTNNNASSVDAGGSGEEINNSPRGKYGRS